MTRASKVIITIVIVAAVGVIGWVLISSMSSTNESIDTSGSNQTDKEPVLTITYNGTEFSPSEATVAVGDVVEVVNDSQNVMEFASDQHPTHLENSEFNVGDIQPGDSARFTVTTAGTWGYHDHYNATANGELIVE